MLAYPIPITTRSKIYQLKVNDEELLFEIKDYKTAEILKAFPFQKPKPFPLKAPLCGCNWKDKSQKN